MGALVTGQLAIAPTILGACPHEVETVRISERGTKSLCDVMGREVWTNCREWGSCCLKGEVPDGS